jgi:hypothetical protein
MAEASASREVLVVSHGRAGCGMLVGIKWRRTSAGVSDDGRGSGQEESEEELHVEKTVGTACKS